MSKREVNALGTPAASRPDLGSRGKEEVDKLQQVMSLLQEMGRALDAKVASLID